MNQLPAFLAVFLGGGLGSMARHAVGRAGIALLGPDFPYATMAINVTGSFLMGVVAGWFALRGQGGQTTRLFLTTGFLGGYTTYSTFSLEIALLWERGEVVSTLLYAGGTLLLGLLGIFGGLAMVRALA